MIPPADGRAPGSHPHPPPAAAERVPGRRRPPAMIPPAGEPALAPSTGSCSSSTRAPSWNRLPGRRGFPAMIPRLAGELRGPTHNRHRLPPSGYRAATGPRPSSPVGGLILGHPYHLTRCGLFIFHPPAQNKKGGIMPPLICMNIFSYHLSVHPYYLSLSF